MTQSYCNDCDQNHDNVDCPWKPAVSGVYEANVPDHTLSCSFKKYDAYKSNMQANPWNNQVGGQHYKKGIQPFEYAMANNLNSLEFSVVKYLRKKGDKAKRIEDLKKAMDCLEKLIWWEEHDGKI
jgi:hypothetical protein